MRVERSSRSPACGRSGDDDVVITVSDKSLLRAELLGFIARGMISPPLRQLLHMERRVLARRE